MDALGSIAQEPWAFTGRGKTSVNHLQMRQLKTLIYDFITKDCFLMLACKLGSQKSAEFTPLSIWLFDFWDGERLIESICDSLNLGNGY